jgi:hypothetical protein
MTSSEACQAHPLLPRSARPCGSLRSAQPRIVTVGDNPRVRSCDKLLRDDDMAGDFRRVGDGRERRG